MVAGGTDAAKGAALEAPVMGLFQLTIPARIRLKKWFQSASLSPSRPAERPKLVAFAFSMAASKSS